MSSTPAPSVSANIFTGPRPRAASINAARPKRKRRSGRETYLPAAVIVGLFVAWQAIVWGLDIPVYVLPSPTRIVAALWAIPGTLLMHTAATFGTILAGFALSIVVALPLAALIALSPTARIAIYPLLILSQSVPKIALAPIMVLLLGTNVMPKIVITFLVAFFPLVVSTAAGLSGAPRELIELGRSLQASKLKELLRIRLPYAIPYVFSGLKVAITMAVIGAVVGEFVAADRGLGFLMTSSLAFFNTPVGFGAIMVLSILAMALFQAVVLVEQVFFPWATRMRS